MSIDNEKRLEHIEDMVENNNEILKKILRIQRLARIARVVYWIIIIGVAIGAFYFIQPFLDEVREIFKSGADILNLNN